MHNDRYQGPQRWLAAAQRGWPAADGARPDLRIGDAERTAVTEALQRHYAEGRLDGAELEERLDLALSAKTEHDLVEVVRDLPGTPPWLPAPTARDGRLQHRRSGRPRFLGVALTLVLVVFVPLALVTSAPVLFALVRILFFVLIFGLLFRQLRRILSR
ncbi:DUF1707 domain-containing protein [Actinocorallia sp. B10E7]|uniref:DUF1707 SHOCT-like domain-containing protein n=1 Tax=Actinocorallia sp. B10E7 TaxID=3153558 RepID=UPI00325F3BA5